MAADDLSSDLVSVGKIVSPFGVKGWVKILSYTQTPADLFTYKPWLISRGGSKLSPTEISVSQFQRHGKGYVALVAGCSDRDEAILLSGVEISVDRTCLPSLSADEVYWADLKGLNVVNLQGEKLGVVDHLMDTAANDVLVVKPGPESIDEQERLIPYVLTHVVKRVSLPDRLIEVDWGVDY